MHILKYAANSLHVQKQETPKNNHEIIHVILNIQNYVHMYRDNMKLLDRIH